MERVDLKIGFKCNNRCYFCVQGRKREKLPFKNLAEIKESLDEAFQKGKKEVVLTGGEPTLHPDFLKIIKTAVEIGYEEIQIQTNGRLFAYEDFCHKVIEAGATQFSPALHGSVPEIHDYLTRAENSFSQTVAGIKNLKKLGQYVLTNSVITTKNYRDLPSLAKILVSLNVNQFQFAFVHIVGRAEENREWLVPRKSEIIKYLIPALEIGRKAGIKATTEAIPYCLMKGYEEFVVEEHIPNTRIYDAGFTIDNYSNYRKSSGKVKRGECAKCKFDEICEGPWKEYPEQFGWEEFKFC